MSHNRLVSVVIVAMLAFALTGSLQAQTSAAATSVPVSALTPQLMTKMLQLIALRGIDRELAAEFANPLGLTNPGQSWPNRQVASYGVPSKFNHGFAVSRGSDQDIVISLRSPETIYVFRSNRGGKIVAARSCDIKNGGQITMLDFADAQKALDNEIRFWAKNVDKLIAGK